MEKFNLKNQALKVHEKKLQQQLQQRKEMGKAEYEVENESVRVYTERLRKLEKQFYQLCLDRLSVDCVVCELEVYAREQ